MGVQNELFMLATALITMATAAPLATYPCTGQSRYVPYAIEPHRYVLCDDIYGPLILFCPLNYVWDQALQTCVPPGVGVTHVLYVTTTQPAGVIGFTAPCTKENIQQGKLFFAYPYDSSKYIQCDSWGDAYLKSCQPGFYFLAEASQCV